MDQTDKKNPSFGHAFRIIWPLMLANSVVAVMQFTDRIFLSRYSDEAMQASVPAGTLSYLLLSLMHITVGYAGTFIAQYHGAKRPLLCARTLSQSYWLLLLTAPLTLAMLPIGHFLIGLSNHSAAVTAAEKTYFDIMILSGLSLPVNGALVGFFSGKGRTKFVLSISVLSSVVNILLDWMLIYGKCGFPGMGIRGAALATAIASNLGTLVFFAVSMKDRAFSGKRKFFSLAFDKALSLRILKFGFPSGLHVVLDMLTFTFFVFVTGNRSYFSELEFGASNVCFNINHLVYFPIIGIGSGANILVGNYQGAGDYASARRAGFISLYIGWIYMAAVLLAVLPFIEPIVSIFISPESGFDRGEFLSLSRILIYILMSWCMFDVVNVVSAGALKGAGDTTFVMASGIAGGFLIWVPMIFAVLFLCPSIVNLWLTLPLYILILAIAIYARWHRGKWREIKLIPGENP